MVAGSFTEARPDHQKALTSHSLKVTTLTWYCKFGLIRETRRALGHHADAALGSDAVYGRDAQALAQEGQASFAQTPPEAASSRQVILWLLC